ncbi:Tap42p [Ascoidea rubescens DSM 1968]|uniref:TAP42-like protein n=1 Tax=Ascoidea rubescens DSM 1968 TaxID=1344418 RepID=A0A1D2VNT0_9ASCO|nr:TAP42-like protein [Ascoidea rubescens DSM 1968]ODV63244.1 TAP42-like protein [Ascoidea rubescens DSM 1968]
MFTIRFELSLRQDSLEYQSKANKIFQKLLNLKKIISSLALFSVNESLEELNTNYIKFLSVDYYLALLASKKFDKDNPQAFTLKVNSLKLSKYLYLQFLKTLDNYSILNKDLLQKLKAFQSTENDESSDDNNDSEFKNTIFTNTNPMSRREEKIKFFKYENSINDQLKYYENKYKNLNENDIDEEILRELHLTRINLLVVKAFKDLENIQMELQLLSNRSIPAPKIQSVGKENTNQTKDQKYASKDNKSNILSEENNYGYTENLETLNKSILSKEGKVLRPFTLYSKKDQLRKKVFGTGQELPTMSIEEYLDEEMKRGGIVKQSITGNESDSESDDEEKDNYDEVGVYKKREWDDFTDTHKKGSGNTMNMG